jgi:hypothetical protein
MKGERDTKVIKRKYLGEKAIEIKNKLFSSRDFTCALR